MLSVPGHRGIIHNYHRVLLPGEGDTHVFWDNKFCELLLQIWEESRPTLVMCLKLSLVEAFVEWRHLPVFPNTVKNKCILALGGNLTFTRSSLLRRSMTLMMKSLAIWKFCRPMLSELSNTKRRSTGPHVHSAAKHRHGRACGSSLSCSQSKEARPSKQLMSAVSPERTHQSPVQNQVAK